MHKHMQTAIILTNSISDRHDTVTLPDFKRLRSAVQGMLESREMTKQTLVNQPSQAAHVSKIYMKR